MNKYYKILIEFTDGMTPSEPHLVRRYGKELLNECLLQNFIVPVGRNSVGETIYTITAEGKAQRDN